MTSSLQNFVVAALKEDQRIDGRRPFDSRRLNMKFLREDGSAEVQLGQTLVMCCVSCQLVQPFPDRPNEGSLSVFTEFSPMADSSFEPGRQGENAVELGRVIDRGLRESRAVDTESLCVLAGKAVWSLRIDISILDNGGNLIDAASIAALAALLSFRRPECSAGGEEGQEVIIHPPEIREPLPLILHHLPVAVTFAFFGDGDLVVVDPSYKEELVMKGRLTVTMNVHGDICSVQKGGGVGVSSGEIMRCLRIAATKVADVTSSLKKAAEAHETERAFRKVKRINVAATTEGRRVDISETVKAEFKLRSAILDKSIKSELNDDEDSSSEDSSDDDDDSESKEDNVMAPIRAVKEEDPQSVLPTDAVFQGGVSQWPTGTKPYTISGTMKTNPTGNSVIKVSSSCQEEKPTAILDTAKKNKKRKKKNKKKL
ncbi:hypothetical protein KP509_39G044100 [Ceratopteris richardii]|uniref:Protein ECERIFERUM 7 n=1 Tax=Ceratopteris richardii TaxID=49495 RepID=A0A8T2Q1H8_CERRI|nr:hypothetical protein KP509_39G044100 [Ceratopteris richardii]